jgi:acetoin utilization deacetylase AcuC-like enzyme
MSATYSSAHAALRPETIFVYSALYNAEIGHHVFPTNKYRLIHDRLAAEKIITGDNVVTPAMPDKKDMLRIVTREYADDLVHLRTTARTFPSEMPVARAIIEAQMLCCDGSYQAAQAAMDRGGCYHIGGGFHHAFPDHAEGFCYLNDICYAAVRMLENGVKKIAVVDCDLHQGNGTAKFFEHEDRVFTFSMHQEHLYPKKERSNLDIGLDLETGDDEYLKDLDGALTTVISGFQPQLIIYLAGADPYMFDQLGNLKLTIAGLIERDEMVLGRARENGIAVAAVLGGGYAEDLDDTIEIHCNTARIMQKLF